VRRPEAAVGRDEGVGEALRRGWDELKRGGAAAPYARTQVRRAAVGSGGRGEWESTGLRSPASSARDLVWPSIKHVLKSPLCPHTPLHPHPQGETYSPQDVTSNVERSRHLDDPTQRRIYEAEVGGRGLRCLGRARLGKV
jgi:hypothetical protein